MQLLDNLSHVQSPIRLHEEATCRFADTWIQLIANQSEISIIDLREERQILYILVSNAIMAVDPIYLLVAIL